MLTLVYADFLFIFPFIIILTISWFIYFKFIFFSLKTNYIKKDTLVKHNQIKVKLFLGFNNFLTLLLCLLFSFFFTIKLVPTAFFWDNFYCSEFNISLLSILLVFLIIFFHYNSLLRSQKINVNIDFIFSLFNISIFYFFIFFSNNLLTFIFFLELISYLIFFKFLSSKI